jgi:hypothetical protein
MMWELTRGLSGRILGSMARTIKLEVPEDLSQRLETKATAAGLPIEQYVIDELARIAATPTREEMMERLRKLPRVQTTRDPVDVIREVRDGGRRNSS